MSTVGRNMNFTDTATVADTFVVTLTTATITGAKLDRIYFEVWNVGNKDAWVKLQLKTKDDDKKGIPLPQGSSWRMPPDNIYDGEISVISDAIPSTIIAYEEY